MRDALIKVIILALGITLGYAWGFNVCYQERSEMQTEISTLRTQLDK